MTTNTRTEKATKNMLTSLFAYVFLFVIGILVRRILLDSFSTELVGYDGLISEIFSFVSLADFGADSLFTYRLYEAFANNNKKRIGRLVSLYRLMFFVLGFIVAFICIVLYLLLPNIFGDKVQFWFYFKMMFILYSLSSLSTYFFGYWRVITAAAQMEYKAIRIETIMSFIAIIAKIFVLITTKDYLLYLFLTTGCNVLSRVLVSLDSKKNFYDLSLEKVTLRDLKNEGMLTESKDTFIIKISDTVIWSSTNLLTSLLINVQTAALYYNYSLISSTLYDAIIVKFLRPIRSSIADMIYKDEKDVSFGFYKTLSLSCYFVASVILVCFASVFQNAISVLFGNQYLLSMTFTIMISLYFYIMIKMESMSSFRSCFGEYDVEAKFSIVASIVNIVVAILLAKKFGIVGIITGSIIAVIIKWISDSTIVISHFYKRSLLKEAIDEFKYLLLACFEMIIVLFVSKDLTYNFLNMVVRGLIGMIIPTIINVLIFRKNESFETIMNITKDFVVKIYKTVKEKTSNLG